MKNVATPTLGVESSTSSSRTVNVRTTQRWKPERHQVIAVLVNQPASLTGAGLFVESPALMKTMIFDATRIAIDGARMRGES